MRSYLNDINTSSSIINSLPDVLKNAIIDTVVVSGHGSTSGENNFTSTDKLYLLSAHEVWEDDDGDPNVGIDYNDTSYNDTRQLDYYAGLNVTISSYSGAIKKEHGSNYYWWLRSAHANSVSNFLRVYTYGRWDNYEAYRSIGVSPAFRIG